MTATNNSLMNLEILVNNVTLISHLGEAVDLTAIFTQVELFESIFSPTLSGNIIINDSTNLIKNLPIIGQEKLEISFASPLFKEEPVVLSFNIYKIDNRVRVNERSQIYSLDFISEHMIKDKLTKVSRFIEGKSSDVIRKLLTMPWGLDSKKENEIELSEDIVQFVVPNWSPVKSISYFTKRALNTNHNPCYLFWEGIDKFYFVSLESLFKSDIISEFNVSPKYIGTISPEANLRNIRQYNVSESFNILEDISNGVYASSYLETDIIHRTINYKTYDYLENFKKQTHVEQFPMLPESDNLDKLNYTTQFESNISILDNEIDSFDRKKYSDWYLQRKSLMGQLKSLGITAYLKGNSNLRAGQMVKIHLPSPEPKSREQVWDDYLSGKFLVASVRHSFSQQNYNITAEFIKDSVATQLPDSKGA